ncbi:Hypothetical protein R9X50_00683400 [Acrodontium crateriforme]|uniref:Zn(2)-C6 fungal-type domain-containing protein n=1 Tax=Acrodontium crateriforme TaxID=150365 RepID=A0AAQ3R736_9PEZI|nr:Hypothetical protein R9X50_00683400 [Acrodontium crateriforme]
MQRQHDITGPRRIQNSSCDQCRKARVACDAVRLGVRGKAICTRCRKRKHECTFEFVRTNKDVKPANNESKRRRRNAGGKTSVDVARPIHDLKDTLIQDATDSEEAWLSSIYESGFEMVFGSWIGSYSNPFVFRDTAACGHSVSISQLCRELDAWTATDPSPSYTGQVDESLRLAIQAFAARWLPISSLNTSQPCFKQSKISALWRQTRREMLKAINRPTYRSMLTLILFGLTPIPDDVSEVEEVDGISGQVCIQAALQQIVHLRARQRSLQFNGSKVSSDTTTSFNSPGQAVDPSQYINAENIVLWAALTFDTSASLTIGSRPLLSSGLFGFESEASWKLVQSCMNLFRSTFQDWETSELDVTEDMANQIIAAAAAWKLYVWKMVAVFKEALCDGHGEMEVNRAFTAVVAAIDQFNSTYRGLLTVCQSRIHFLSQETKLRWYVATLHYHLSILMLVDVIEATDRLDLLSRLTAARSEAESWALNCLVFGLENTFTLAVPRKAGEESAIKSRGSVTVPLVSIDPYPHHVLAAVKLLRKAIEDGVVTGKITRNVHATLLATLERALKQLPASSKSVRAARDEMNVARNTEGKA